MTVGRIFPLIVWLTIFVVASGTATAQTSSVTCKNMEQIGSINSIEIYLDYKDIPAQSLGINIDSFGKLLADQVTWAIAMCQLKINPKDIKVFMSRDKEFDKLDNLILYVKARPQNVLNSGFGTQKYDLNLLYQFFRPGASLENQIFFIEQAESVSLPVNASTEKILSNEIGAATRSYLIGVTGMEDNEVLREGKYNIQ